MGFFESINRAFFNLTYNEKASQAYDQQNEKAAGAVEDLKKQVQGYRDVRDKLLSEDKASDYFSSNSLQRITEWENWIEKNGGLAAGDYSQKSTEMKTQWEGIFSSNKIVLEMQRIPDFLDLFLKDKELTIPNAQKQELVKLKQDAETYLKNMTTKTPAEILAKRDEYNRQFMDIQKKIPENFADMKEGFASSEPQLTLLQGIDETYFNDYKNRVEQKERSEEDTFRVGRLTTRTWDYFGQGFGFVWKFFIGFILAMIVANDMIGRQWEYRFYFFGMTWLLCQMSFIPGFPFILLAYYLYRAFSGINWGNLFSFNPTGPRVDYMKVPVLFNVLPLFEIGEGVEVSWFNLPFVYNPNLYGNLAAKKRFAYEALAADAVGKKLDPSLFDFDISFDEILSSLKSSMLGIQKKTLVNAIDSLKEVVT